MVRYGPRTEDGRGVASVVGPVIDLQTYKNLAYLLLAFPLGFAYYLFLTLGFTVGVVFSILIVGILLLAVAVLLARLLARFERWLAVRLLAVDLPPWEDVDADSGAGETIRAYLDDGATWRGLGFLAVKFWLGLVGVVLLFGFTSALSMLSAPARLPHDAEFGELNGEPLTWTIETLPEAALAAAIGAVAVLFLVHLVNGFAYAAGRMAEALLAGPAVDGTANEPPGASGRPPERNE